MTLIFPGMTMRHRFHGLVLVRRGVPLAFLHSHPRNAWVVKVLTGEFRNALRTVPEMVLSPEFASEEWL